MSSLGPVRILYCMRDDAGVTPYRSRCRDRKIALGHRSSVDLSINVQRILGCVLRLQRWQYSGFPASMLGDDDGLGLVMR